MQRFVKREGSSEDHAADVAFASAVEDIATFAFDRCGGNNDLTLVALMSTAAAFAEDKDLEKLALEYIEKMRMVWMNS